MIDLATYDAASVAETEGASPQPVTLNDRTLTGYAVVWGAVSSPRADGSRHVYERGSITWSDDLLALWHHDLAVPLAGRRNRSLRIVEDDIGALVEIDLDRTQAGEDALTRVRSQLVRGMSFGTPKSSQAFEPTGNPQVQRVTRAFGIEVSLTPTPSMRETAIVTNADAKNLERQMQELKAQRVKNRLNQLRFAMMRSR